MAITDDIGDVVRDYEYDVYGQVAGGSGSTPNEFDFAGQQSDDTTGLQYLRARYYDPETGIFISRDPIAAGPGWVDNPYGYASASPANLIDPIGLCPELTWCDVEGIPGIEFQAVGEEALAEGRAEPRVQMLRKLGYGQPIFRICYGPTESDCSEGATAYSWQVFAAASAKYVAERAARLVGEYIRVGSRTYRIGDHAAKRMAERGITKGRLRHAMNNGKAVKYRHSDGTCRTAFYHRASNIFIALAANGKDIATVFQPRQGEAYVTNKSAC